MSKDNFGDEIAAWAQEAPLWAAEQAAIKTRSIFIKVCEFSPRQGYGRFSTGHFMKNWRPTGVPVSGEITGEATLAAKVAEINKVIDDEFFLGNEAAYFTNNTHYAYKVEETGWHDDGQNTDAYQPMELGIKASAPVANAVAASM